MKRFTDHTKTDEKELKDVRVRHRDHAPDQGVPDGDGRAHHDRRGVVNFEDHLNMEIRSSFCYLSFILDFKYFEIFGLM